jgi:hypothetical protein
MAQERARTSTQWLRLQASEQVPHSQVCTWSCEKARTHRTIWLLVNHAYKNNQLFIYSTVIETGYTAEVFGDFVKSFSAGWLDSATCARIGCIRHLIVIQDHHFSFSEGLTDSVNTDRSLGFYERGHDNHMVMSTIFIIVRILSTMQRCKMHTTITFPKTLPSFRPWLEEVYTMRKRLAPNVGSYSQDIEWWTLRTRLSCPDKFVDLIRYDAQVWDLYREGESHVCLEEYNGEKPEREPGL